MKATALLVNNYTELVEAEKLNLPKQQNIEWIEQEFYFNIHAVLTAFITNKNEIKVLIENQIYLLKNEPQVWGAIKKWLEEN